LLHVQERVANPFIVFVRDIGKLVPNKGDGPHAESEAEEITILST
jgi:hypothetical protein